MNEDRGARGGAVERGPSLRRQSLGEDLDARGARAAVHPAVGSGKTRSP